MDWDKVISHKPVQKVNWNKRDQILYVVGIGGKASELPLVYELHKDWKPFPTYPLVLALKGDGNELSNFGEMKDQGGATPGMPKVDASKIVHAEQSLHILKSIPAVSGPGWTIRKQCVGLKDVGKGLIIDGAQELVGPDGEVYVRMVSSAYAFGDYKLNKFNKSIAPKQPATALKKPPTTTPDAIMEEYVSEEQALIYRLSGDYNPLHIDPAVGKSIGFPGTILHGLCSYGHCARAIVLKAADGDGSRLTYISARFTSPVIPGDTLITKMWFTDSSEGRRVDFTQTIKASGKMCLGGGVALLKSKGSKL